MAEKKRQCGTCRFFVEKENSGHGKCTHPQRAGTDADLLLLRPNELACRTRWGTSLWQDPADDSDPNAPKSPQQPTLPEPIAAQLQFDDEVTSVSIAGSKSSRSSYEDDVVDSGAVASGMASWNDPVQEERLDLLRKGSHDAVAGARKRHMEKQARQRELIPFAEDEDSADPETKPGIDEQASSTREPATGRDRDFAPDDFVEEERTAAEDDASFEDEMVDDGISPDKNRSPRLRKLLREPRNPKSNEAMRVSMPTEMRVTSHNPEHREQWNSVPTLNPGIELPLSTRDDRPASTPIKVAASAAPMASSSYQVRPVSQARELLSEDRLRQERAQRQMVAPLIDDESRHPEPAQTQTVTDRPRLTEAPSYESAPLEQIKSSPLRGYHPATRKLTQPAREQSPQQRPAREAEHRPEPSRSANQWNTYDASPVRRSQQGPQRSSDPPMNSRRQEQVETRTQSRPQEQRERRPYIPLHQANTPYVREEIEISPDVPRCCGTCTSYRPSNVPGRGSCTNGFAGPVQRVVYEQDLACQHTFGSFWLPADEEVWLDELDDLTQPTPRVDAMLARRRRRNTTVLPDLEELTS